MPIAWFVAQADQSGQPWLNLDDLFWMTVLGVFALTIIGALVRTRQRDKCLKLLNDHHVTYLPVDGKPMWGDLYVASSGLELCFSVINHQAGRSLGMRTYRPILWRHA